MADQIARIVSGDRRLDVSATVGSSLPVRLTIGGADIDARSLAMTAHAARQLISGLLAAIDEAEGRPLAAEAHDGGSAT